MLKLKLQLELLASLLFCACISSAEEKSLAAFDQVVQEMNEKYYDPSFSGLEWKKLCQESRQKILKSETTEQGYAIIQELLGQFKHSHMAFHPNQIADVGYHKQIDFTLNVVEGKWVVTSVIKDTNAWEAGLRKGFIIESMGEGKKPLIEAKNDAGCFYEMKELLNYYPETSILLKGKDTENNATTIKFELKAYEGKSDTLGNISSGFEVEKKQFANDIGYLSFSIFMFQPVMQSIEHLKVMQKKAIKAVILDVRGNPGGVGFLASAIAKEFSTRDYSLGTMSQRHEEPLNFPVIAQAKPFDVPVVILTDLSSASTAEILAGGMQAHSAATVIGSRTAGAVLPSHMLEIEGGGIFQFPVADFKTADGRSLEGVGVQPDIEVNETIESLRLGKDLALEKAVEFLRNKIAAKNLKN